MAGAGNENEPPALWEEVEIDENSNDNERFDDEVNNPLLIFLGVNPFHPLSCPSISLCFRALFSHFRHNN